MWMLSHLLVQLKSKETHFNKLLQEAEEVEIVKVVKDHNHLIIVYFQQKEVCLQGKRLNIVIENVLQMMNIHNKKKFIMNEKELK